MAKAGLGTVAFDFDGAVALVTGAASGIGRETARAFAAAGARVVLTDLAADAAAALAAELGPSALAAPADVTDADAVRAVTDRAMAQWGRIDCLVNCAGIADEMKPTFEQDIDRWQRVLDVSLRGSYLFSREAGRHMAAARAGAIVNFASIAGLVGLPGRNAYSAAKAGLITMTKGLASEWGCYGIRVNAVAPGYVDTPMVEGLMARGRIGTEGILRRTPLGRFGQPQEIATAVLFLCSAGAAYITGACLSVDGGWVAFGGNALPEAGHLG